MMRLRPGKVFAVWPRAQGIFTDNSPACLENIATQAFVFVGINHVHPATQHSHRRRVPASLIAAPAPPPDGQPRHNRAPTPT